MYFFFFFNDTATTEIYTLSLHDALPILPRIWRWASSERQTPPGSAIPSRRAAMLTPSPKISLDRKSTRLNSSHANISYAVFCLRKKEHTSELQSRQYIVCRHMLE